MTTTDNASRRYAVISADSHAGADLLDYKPYLATKWHDEFDAWAAAYSNPWDFMDPRVPEEGEEDEFLYIAASSWHCTLNWESDKRKKHLTQEGVVGEVLYPNTAPPFMPTSVLEGKVPNNREEYERRWAGLQAHNRWLQDFCDDWKGHRAGVAQVMLYDIDDAIAEVRDLRAKGLKGGILLPMGGKETMSLSFASPEYDRLWAVCEELQVPVHQHGSTPYVEPDSNPVDIAMALAEFSFFNRRILTQMIYAGVFERFPALKLVIAEVGSGWVPQHLAQLDGFYYYGKFPGEGPFKNELSTAMGPLSMAPSEYFARNCYLGASLLMRSEVAARETIGRDKMMWGMDYPHAEGTYPYTLKALQLAFAGVPEEEVRVMLGGAAAEVFEFDLEELQKLADEVGPTVAEVAQAPVDPPQFGADSFSPVFGEGAAGDIAGVITA